MSCAPENVLCSSNFTFPHLPYLAVCHKVCESAAYDVWASILPASLHSQSLAKCTEAICHRVQMMMMMNGRKKAQDANTVYFICLSFVLDLRIYRETLMSIVNMYANIERMLRICIKQFLRTRAASLRYMSERSYRLRRNVCRTSNVNTIGVVFVDEIIWC